MNKKFLSLVAGLALPLLLSTSSSASTISQSGANPIVFDTSATTDNLVVLMAAGAERNSELQISDFGAYKHFWINNFGAGSGGDYLKWHISVPATASYRVWAFDSAASSIPWKISCESYSLTFNTNSYGWDKLDCGVITLPAGTHDLYLERNGGNGSGAIKSLELIRESDKSAYETRVASFKKDNVWFADSKYGLMFQYGAWGCAANGSQKSIDQGAADFDVTAFVNKVKNTGAQYVVWSATWYRFWFQAPIPALDSIMGSSTYTASRNLIKEIAVALKAENIRFMLYYHQGMQQESGWATQQSWPSEFQTRGTGDRSRFFDNWCAVVKNIGDSLGTNLDGWFFDDGCIYYPAPFERLGTAARSGNSDRLVSYNPWVATRVTDFQDVYFAEGTHGEAIVGSAPAGSNGIITSGPHKGLLQQAMFMVEQDWGVHVDDQRTTAITTGITSSESKGWIRDASPRNLPLTFNLMMWEDGIPATSSLDVLYSVRDSFATPLTGSVNNTSEYISYSGTWAASSHRGSGDYGDDVYYTANNNDYFQYTFTGTSVSLIMIKDNAGGDVDIYIDNSFVTTVSTYNSTYLAQQVVYSNTSLSLASHTIKAVKKSGSYMQLDRIKNSSTHVNYNDGYPGMIYSGSSWGYSAPRATGDFCNDLHYTTTNNDYFQLAFSGTSVSIVMAKDNSGGDVDVYIDGSFVTTVSSYNSSYLAQQTVYSNTSLSSGSHTVKGVKKSGTYMQLDNIIVH